MGSFALRATPAQTTLHKIGYETLPYLCGSAWDRRWYCLLMPMQCRMTFLPRVLFTQLRGLSPDGWRCVRVGAQPIDFEDFVRVVETLRASAIAIPNEIANP